MMSEIQKAVLLKQELDSLSPLSNEEEQRIMQKFRLDWNYHSNNLEGNSLTYGETKALILFGITAQGKPLKDHFEVTGHDEAIKWVMEIVHEERSLNENFIRELHKLILKESYEVDAITPDGLPTKKRVNIGAYKTTPNHVKTKTGEIFRFASPEETPALMSDLISWYKSKKEEQDLNPILLAAEFHYKYIRIHPFDDGNGRTARILMNFILMQFGYPPVIIKTEDKENYFSSLRQADAGMIEPFIEYISRNLNYSMELMIKAAKGESIEEPDDLEKEIALLEQKLKTVSQSIEVTKNIESILNIYDQSILKLIKKFIAKSELFKKFYVDSKPILSIGKIYQTSKIEEHELTAREVISRLTIDELNTISIEYKYIAFNHTGFQEFNFLSLILFQFGYTHYQIKDSHGAVKCEKRYDEQLTEKELNSLIDLEMRRHKNTIDNRIERIKKINRED